MPSLPGRRILDSRMRALAIGGTGFIGRRVVDALERRGHDVWTLSRREGGERHLRGERSRLAELVGGRAFEGVVDLAAYHPRDVVEAIAALRGVSRYVFISSGVVHRNLHGRPAREEDAVLPEGDPPAGELGYSDGKRWCESMLRRARSAGFPAVAVRPPAVLGAEDRTSRIAGYLARIEDGAPVLAPAGLVDRGIGVVWSRDVGEVCALVLEGKGQADAYNVAFPDLTLRKLVDSAAEALGASHTQLVEVPESSLATAGLDLFEVSPYGPDRERPGGYDLTRIRHELGFEPSPLAAALDECVAWYRTARPDGQGYAGRERELELVRTL